MHASTEITIHAILDDPGENRMSDVGISRDPSTEQCTTTSVLDACVLRCAMHEHACGMSS